MRSLKYLLSLAGCISLLHSATPIYVPIPTTGGTGTYSGTATNLASGLFATNLSLINPNDATFSNLSAGSFSIIGTNSVLVLNWGGTNYYFALGTNGYGDGKYLKWNGVHLEADTPAGSGDMEKTTYDTDTDNVVDIASALESGVTLTNVFLKQSSIQWPGESWTQTGGTNYNTLTFFGGAGYTNSRLYLMQTGNVYFAYTTNRVSGNTKTVWIRNSTATPAGLYFNPSFNLVGTLANATMVTNGYVLSWEVVNGMTETNVYVSGQYTE